MRGNGRQRTDPIAPLTRLLESTLTVADIVSTPLWSVGPEMMSADVLDAMDVHGFDVGGVGPEPIQRFVERSLLSGHEGTVDEVSTLIPAAHCVEKSLPVSALLTLFTKRERLFVLDGEHVRWVVTRADLASPAVGVAVLAFLTMIETGLQQLAQGCSDEEIAAKIRRKRDVDSLFEKKIAHNAETSWRACLYFTDWLTVVGKTPAIRERLGYPSSGAWNRQTKSLPDVRNDLAHGRDLLHDGDPVRTLQRIERIRAVATAVWAAIREQDPIWDDYARTVITIDEPHLRRLSGPGAMKAWRFPARCHVITAWNPGSVWMSEERNHESNRRLHDALERNGGRVFRATGSSPDRTWVETSFLVTGLSRAVVCSLATAFGQLAIFELSAERVHVVDASTARTVRIVPRISSS